MPEDGIQNAQKGQPNESSKLTLQRPSGVIGELDYRGVAVGRFVSAVQRDSVLCMFGGLLPRREDVAGDSIEVVRPGLSQ